MSAQELADETERLGHGISRSQIANYESGRKKASTWPSCL
jgi:predicted transcriptional regulator